MDQEKNKDTLHTVIYEPDDDTFLIADALKKELKLFSENTNRSLRTASVLDMGAGSGYLGFEAMKQGVGKVTFVDINKQAIQKIQEIIDLEELPAKTIHSNLHAHVKETFDVIVFNTPYLPNEKEGLFDSALHGGKEGNEVAIQFISELKQHLNPNGFCLLLTSSLAQPKKIEQAIQKEGFSFFIIATEKLFFEKLMVYKIVATKN